MSDPVNAHLFYSLDGVVTSPHAWQFDAFGPEEGQLMGAGLAGVTDVVIGRTLWQEWKEFWNSDAVPEQDPFRSFINPVRKHVITATLSEPLGWNSTAVTGDPVAYVRDLAQRAEGRVLVTGGVQTVRSLFDGGAIDHLTLTVHPVVAGKGERLFDDAFPLTRLQLVDSTITPAGNAVLTYARRG